MARFVLAMAGLLVGGAAAADNLAGVDRFLCATAQVIVCVEDGECFTVPPAEVDVPEFVIFDVRNKALSTTQASGLNRTTAVASVTRADGFIYMQGVDTGRAFSFVVNEATGHITAAVSRDGAAVSVFGACTDADVE
jgi:hypothetical protein